ncbi:MAG: GDSL-type esterase/lipase family protein [Candidatus Pedobacter colombiensis]|uniref:GDSL-type esterase/lipase family protein n=1 Tax=Candidatus Pedobacter colombiensis TaxID=3121371 RepID=A0AAJ5W8K3_9SPHI|nr:GDSL-type esterase/lipase family protein [Pedobacter sp.]WEK19183.1 MAG: GDSL-type esterase/lipase family protein [Pedobacter sp.]
MGVYNMIRGFGLACLFTLLSFVCFAQGRPPVCGPFAQFYNKDSINIVTFGASTVQGVPAPLNFQGPLKSFLENCYKGKPIVITNYGIAGETTTEGLNRFDVAIANQSGFLLILMGANDAVQIADGKARVSTTIANMREMVTRAKNHNLTVIIGTLQYFVEPPGKGSDARLAQRRNRVIDQINAAYASLTKELNIGLADFNAVIGRNKQLYSDDIHPNARGYHVLAFVFFDAINQMISERFQAAGVLQNYPNPANAFTKLRFNLSSAAAVKVSLYNVMGQRIGVVFDDYRNAGYHEEEISTLQYSPGMYFLVFEMLDLRFTKKIVIVH